MHSIKLLMNFIIGAIICIELLKLPYFYISKCLKYVTYCNNQTIIQERGSKSLNIS